MICMVKGANIAHAKISLRSETSRKEKKNGVGSRIKKNLGSILTVISTSDLKKFFNTVKRMLSSTIKRREKQKRVAVIAGLTKAFCWVTTNNSNKVRVAV